MAEPIIIIRENGLVIEVDLKDEQLDPPQVTPSGSGQHQKYTIRWPQANYQHGTYQCVEEPDSTNPGRKQARVEKSGGEAEAY